MSNENKYWKCEYENLRRKKNKELKQKAIQSSSFVHKTLDLLHMLGLDDEQIFAYYRNEPICLKN